MTAQLEQMVFLVGPRQVGKTTISKALAKDGYQLHYLNWDVEDNSTYR